jgi:multidrug efflux pump subunit AcrA (membrane-fusion protein)
MNRFPSLLITISFLFTVASCGKQSDEIKPIKRDLAEVVYASGNIYPENEYKVFSNVTGFLEQALVNEGDTIQTNEILFLIAGPNRRSETEATTLALKIAEENAGKNSPLLMQLQQRYQNAKSKASNDSINLNRYSGLVKTGAVSQAEYDRIALQTESSQREARVAFEQYESQMRTLQVELANARNRFNQAVNNFGDGSLRSAINGRVFEVYKQVGDFIHQNEAIALVGSGNKPVARLSIDEADLALVKVGQKVYIQLDALPGKTLLATVKKIYPKLNKAEQSFRVDATFDEIPPVDLYGLNIEANILIKEAKNILTIPRKILLAGDSVTIKRDGKEMKVKVETGVSDLSFVEIRKGILETDELIK